MIDSNARAIAGSVIFLLATGIGGWGVTLITMSGVSLPPVPGGFLVGALYTICGLAFMLTAATALATTDEFRPWLRKGGVRIHLSICTFCYFAALCVIGVYIIAFVHPYESPLCTCPEDTFGEDCEACDCNGRGVCDDGYSGTGLCRQCDDGWTGDHCDICATNVVDGPLGQCSQCREGFAWPGCTTCLPPYTGTNCSVCRDNFQPQCKGTFQNCCDPASLLGGPAAVAGFECYDCDLCDTEIICVPCRKGFSTRYCTQCETCVNAADTCQENPSREGVVPDLLSGIECRSDYECESFFCYDNKCAEGDVYEGTGDCNCQLAEHVGPRCEPCNDAVIRPCNDGECAWNTETQRPECVCAAGFAGDACQQSTVDGSCAAGFYGPRCERCDCGGHGTCDDDVDGTGDCTCIFDPFAGRGAWQGDHCGECYDQPPWQGIFGGAGCLPCPFEIVNGIYQCVV